MSEGRVACAMAVGGMDAPVCSQYRAASTLRFLGALTAEKMRRKLTRV